MLGLCSFVVCLGLLTGIPAIACGHVARGRARRQPNRYAGSGLALAGVILGYLSIVFTLLVAAVVLPQIAKNNPPRRAIQKTGCEYNLRQVWLSLKLWSLDHDGQFPFTVSTNFGGTLELCARAPDGFDTNAVAHFKVISNELSSPGFLVCPEDRAKHAASNFEELQEINVSYELRTGVTINATNALEVLAVCPIHGNTLYCNGEVRKVSRAAK